MTDTAISIQADGSTLRIADPVTGEQYAIHADQPVTPTPSNDDLAVPVSQTVRLEAEKLIKFKENTCGFSRRMNPTTQNQTTLQ